MKKESDKIHFAQKRRFLLVLLGIFLLAALVTFATTTEKKQVTSEQPLHVDLPGKDLDPEEIRISSLETKNSHFEQRVRFLEKMLENWKEEEEKKHSENSTLQSQVEKLQQELSEASLSSLAPPVSYVPEESERQPPPVRLQVYLRPEIETEYGNVLSAIPSGTTVQAVLVSSVDAPCGVHSPTDPHPVKLRVLANGKLPHDVEARLKGSIFIGSAYGELSSERVYIRIERMTQVEKTGEFLETEVAGFVTGEDGKYGIRGIVVDRSNQLIASAAFAGFLDGVNQYLQATINAQTLAKATQGLPSRDVINLEVLKSSSLNGVSSGLDKLSDYYIQRAEQLQPVIQVGAGRIVDITFTHQADLGDLHTQDKIQNIRERNR